MKTTLIRELLDLTDLEYWSLLRVKQMFQQEEILDKIPRWKFWAREDPEAKYLDMWQWPIGDGNIGCAIAWMEHVAQTEFGKSGEIIKFDGMDLNPALYPLAYPPSRFRRRYRVKEAIIA